MYIGLHVKYQLFLSDFKENWIFSSEFWKDEIFNENPSRGNRGGPYGITDRQTDMTKLTVALYRKDA
jgi:hypothetical protein